MTDACLPLIPVVRRKPLKWRKRAPALPSLTLGCVAKRSRGPEAAHERWPSKGIVVSRLRDRLLPAEGEREGPSAVACAFGAKRESSSTGPRCSVHAIAEAAPTSSAVVTCLCRLSRDPGSTCVLVPLQNRSAALAGLLHCPR